MLAIHSTWIYWWQTQASSYYAEKRETVWRLPLPPEDDITRELVGTTPNAKDFARVKVCLVKKSWILHNLFGYILVYCWGVRFR
jgi:hypothetical protein